MSEAIVRIWWFGSGTVGRTVAYSLGAGHGSVEVLRNKKASTYITWAAREPRSKNWVSQSSHSSAATSLIGVSAGDQYNYDSDKRVYGSKEHFACKIPIRDTRHDAIFCGLDGDAMCEWWRDQLQSGLGRYKLISKKSNCDAVTVRALLAGGADCYATPPKNIFYQGAWTLMEWVAQIRKNILSMNDGFKRARQLLLEAGSARLANDRFSHVNSSCLAQQDNRTRIPTVAEWKHRSRVRIGSRHEQIAKIDSCLAEYWNASHQVAWYESQLKRNALVKILHQVYLHLTLKPNSNRRKAVIELGVTVLAAVMEQNQHFESAFNESQQRMGGELAKRAVLRI